MKFKSISIKNFRNFEDIKIILTNKNVFFGMNDVGKTNFLYALRYVFDKEVRRNGFVESDFFQKKTDTPIDVTVCVDIEDVDDIDSEKLRAKVKGALLSSHNQVFIKLIAEYNKTEMSANPVMYWGGDEMNLQEIKAKGYNLEIDSVFSVIYIDAYVDLYRLFKKNIPFLIKNDNTMDKSILEEIDDTVEHLNSQISSLSGIKNFESKISPEYRGFRDDNTEVSVKSEMAVSGLFSNIMPYIKKSGSESLYPTSGEGRKKQLVYSIYDLLSEETSENKINIFLIEEPENHLHRSMQLSLSKRLFVEEKYKYMFMTTHSSYILSEMDKVNLVRIHNETKLDTYSSFYTVPDNFSSQKQRLNKNLSEAIFADKVLLVEGPSEELLFSKVLSTIRPYFEADGIYILKVDGIVFKEYIKVLKDLNIKYIVKTDNDLRSYGNDKYSVIGFSRVNGLIGRKILPEDIVIASGNIVFDKRKLYDRCKTDLDQIRINYNIHLSRVSLEEDLDEVLHDEMIEYLPNANGNAISYLQASKKYNMVELVEKLTDDDCKKIIEHYNFKCLEEILK